jgi:hypothetical protein
MNIILVVSLLINIVLALKIMNITCSSLYYWYDARMDSLSKHMYACVYLRTPEQRMQENIRRDMYISWMRRHPPCLRRK